MSFASKQRDVLRVIYRRSAVISFAFTVTTDCSEADLPFGEVNVT